MHLLRRDLLAVQRRSLGKMLGAFEGADDYGIEARVSDQARGGLQRFLVVACDRYGNAPLGSVGVARYLTIFQRVECTNDARPARYFFDVVAELREGPPPSQGKIVTALSCPEACDISRRVDSLE